MFVQMLCENRGINFYSGIAEKHQRSNKKCLQLSVAYTFIALLAVMM